MNGKVLHIDIETYCDLDLKEVGVYKYSEHPSFKILLTGYAFNDEPVEVTEGFDERLVSALADPNIAKVAHNANFEITCLRKYQAIYIEQWYCTMVMAMQQGLPGKLDLCAQVLGLEHQKDKEGARLIRLFSKPTNLKRKEGDWELFKRYCAQDVEVEREIHSQLHNMREFGLWMVDQEINRRGVYVDTSLVHNAINIAASAQTYLQSQLKSITGLTKITPATIKEYLSNSTGQIISSLAADKLPDLIQAYPDEAPVLELYAQSSKSSVAKYNTMAACACSDNRAKGLTQFYGAGRTGRWSGRLVQLQNLPRIKVSDRALDTARRAVLDGDPATFQAFYGDDQLSILSQLIRTALIPAPGHSFVVADFSAIEARVLAWLAGEQWRLDVFNGDGKIYEASAEKMFHLPAGSVDKHSPYRQKGKIAELALGYGGSKGALVRMGALSMGLSEEELPNLVNLWRAANSRITKLWKDLDYAMAAVMSGQQHKPLPYGLAMSYVEKRMRVKLPSGRILFYVNPTFTQKIGQFMPTVWYMGVNQVTNKWEEQELYGAKLTENIVQALARDCLAEVIVWANENNYRPVFHVHDELVCECPKDRAVEMYDALIHRMQQSPSWAFMLPLNADGFVSDYYKK